MKRHTRPYGCTFSDCFKPFGSRNDWKRHENSQHFLSEMWRCEEPREDGTKCTKLAHSKDKFAKHLQSKHNFTVGSANNEAICARSHLGREAHHHFWCGFCNTLIAQQENMQHPAWDMRFKHIGDHFDKDNRHINDWIDIEMNKKKCLIPRDGKKTKSRSHGARADDDDDDELGDDGIPAFVPGFPAPVSRALPGHDPGMPAQPSAFYTMSKSGIMTAADDDADGVSDNEL